MAATGKLDSRQSEHRTTLPQVTGSTAKPPLSEILPAVNSELTPPFAMRASSIPDLVLNISGNIVQNPETLRNRTNQPIDGTSFTFTSGTVTFPATGAGNIVPSAGSNAALGMTASKFAKVLIQIDDAGAIVLKVGAEAASAAAAVVPSPDTSVLPIGYVTVETDGSNNVQDITDAVIYQFILGGAGGGGGTGILPFVNVSGDITLASGSTYLVDTSAARSLTLPAPSANALIRIKDKTGQAATNNITVIRAGSEEIDQVAASFVMDVNFEAYDFFSDGTDWFLL